MNILILGGGGGSFEMRGRQIGKALGARVLRSPSEADWRWADVAVLVKHAGPQYARQAHQHDVPVVWDVLDCWKQPEENKISVDEGKRLLAVLAAQIRPAVMIAATQQMATDIGGVYIPHHCRIGLTAKPVREHVKIVAYDGQTKYLGKWLDVILRECERRGWHFLVNPSDLSTADILVALRDGKWDGPLCRAWKSGVKIVNAIASGRPVISQPCAASHELNAAGSMIASFDALSLALDHWSEYVRRVEAYERALAFAPACTVDQVAARYRLILQQVVAGATCTA